MSLAIAVQAAATLLAGALVLVVYGAHQPAVPASRPVSEPGWVLTEARRRRAWRQTNSGGAAVAEATCSVDGCANRAVGRALCGSHYIQARRAEGRHRELADGAGRFWSQVKRTESCWLWLGRSNAKGYGTFDFDYQKHRAHRFAYELTAGPIPGGMVLDHICHNEDAACPGGSGCLHRRCVNPDHLEPVTNRENILRGKAPSAVNARKTHCPHGHEYIPENTYLNPATDGRMCRACRRGRTGPRPDPGRFTDPPSAADALARVRAAARWSVF